MEMMFLIIKLGYGSVVIPEKYPKEQCEKLAAGYAGASGYCVPAPIGDPSSIKCASGKLKMHGMNFICE